MSLKLRPKLSSTSSSLITKDIFLPPFSKYFMNAFIWGKIIHNGLTISPCLKPIKCLKSSSLCLNLSDTTILSTFIKSELIGYLDLWNSFLLTLILSSFSAFSPILILRKTTTHLICSNSFLYWISCRYLFLWYSLILFFSSFSKFLYRFFDFSFITSLFCK